MATMDPPPEEVPRLSQARPQARPACSLTASPFSAINPWGAPTFTAIAWNRHDGRLLPSPSWFPRNPDPVANGVEQVLLRTSAPWNLYSLPRGRDPPSDLVQTPHHAASIPCTHSVPQVLSLPSRPSTPIGMPTGRAMGSAAGSLVLECDIRLGQHDARPAPGRSPQDQHVARSGSTQSDSYARWALSLAPQACQGLHPGHRAPRASSCRVRGRLLLARLPRAWPQDPVDRAKRRAVGGQDAPQR